jgi:hypothetical protein
MDTGFGGKHPWTFADIHLLPFLVYQIFFKIKEKTLSDCPGGE